MVIVQKFGGAAMSDGPTIARVARIVADTLGSRVVVVSAMRGVTDTLLSVLDEGRHDEAAIHPLLESLRQRHNDALQTVAPGDETGAYALHSDLERLERLLYGIVYTREATPRLRDLVQSFGERLAVSVLAAALRAVGQGAVALDAEHAGVRTLGPYSNARPDLAGLHSEVPTHLTPHLDAGVVPVVTGYYGVDPGGRATLFGRGGSDFVAGLLGAALDAEAVELWKDVPGFLSADPRAVPGARMVPELGYDEAAELAHVGAKVLHPRAVEPVQAAGIPIRIRCFQDPDAAGSTVCAQAAPSPGLVRGIASRDRLAVLRMVGPGMAYTPGVAKRVFDALAEARINVLNMATSQATFALLLDARDVATARAVLEPLAGGVIQRIETLDDRSLVCAVGRGLGETPGGAARILDAVARQGVNIEMISLGASDIAIDFVVHNGDRAKALQGVHDAFVTEDA